MSLSGNSIKAAQDEQTLDSCLRYIEDRLELASGIEVSTDLAAELATTNNLLYVSTDQNGAASSKEGEIFFRDGQRDAQPVDAFGEGFYGEKTVSLIVTQTNKIGQRPGVTITAILHNSDGSERARLTRSLPLINAVTSENNDIIEYNSQTAAEILVIRAYGYTPPDPVDLGVH
jgi:hypothetical protein